MPQNFLAIDEEGFVLLNEERISDKNAGSQVLRTLHLTPSGAVQCHLKSENYFVEAFDQPLVALRISRPDEKNHNWKIHLQYQVELEFDLSTLSADEWDRFHGLTTDSSAEKQIPFVLSDAAQNQLFNLLDSFDDDSITFRGERYLIKPWMSAKSDIELPSYWTEIYQTETPGWELEKPAPALEEMLPRIKLPKSRVLILGCGSGNDAAFFAQHGHVVTAVDFSPEALSRAKKKYSHYDNINFVEKDIFKIGHEWNESFDLIFEHTCYCAIAPERRNDLVKIWRRLLVPTGQLMGIFFATEKRFGPPYGGTEWELRERLLPYFQMTFWGRWRQSSDRRLGRELFVLGQKISN